MISPERIDRTKKEDCHECTHRCKGKYTRHQMESPESSYNNQTSQSSSGGLTDLETGSPEMGNLLRNSLTIYVLTLRTLLNPTFTYALSDRVCTLSQDSLVLVLVLKLLDCLRFKGQYTKVSDSNCLLGGALWCKANLSGS